ncbi:MAG: 50S ribosomal protein L14 [Candidatus Nanoarchaeia archaeon]|nr:50S ribosomal protein L14 [Candidatus Nanoarchaeia archaeon]
MKAVPAYVARSLPLGARIQTCDNSGAKIIQLINVRTIKTTRRRVQSAGVGDLIMASVLKGKPEMRKQVVFGIIVRQKKEYRRPNGQRVKFEDNAAIVLKDDKGNPKGTMFKGPIAKEVADRWPLVAKVASVVL